MARHLFEHSYDVPTLNGYPIVFTDGCVGKVTNIDGRFAHVRSLPSAEHDHGPHEYAWSTVAWQYIDKGRAFPTGDKKQRMTAWAHPFPSDVR